MAKPLKLKTGDVSPNSLVNTWKHIENTLIPAVKDEESYQVSGVQLREMLHAATLHAHGCGKCREREPKMKLK